MEMQIAKIFKNGASQAVRLPAQFRFQSDEVYVMRDEATGDVVLSATPGIRMWRAFFELLRATDIPDDFLAERSMNLPPATKGAFDDLRRGSGN